MRKRDIKDKKDLIIRVNSISASKKPVHAESIASGGTAEDIIIPVLRNRNVSGIIFETISERKGERIKSPKLNVIG